MLCSDSACRLTMPPVTHPGGKDISHFDVHLISAPAQQWRLNDEVIL